MTHARRVARWLTVAGILLTPIAVAAQHGSEPPAASKTKVEPAPKSEVKAHDAKPAEVRPPESKSAEPKPSEHKAAGQAASASPASEKSAPTHDAKTADVKAESPKAARAETTANREPVATKAKTAGPRVVVRKVDTQTGMAQGSGKAAENSKLEAALARISDRIEDVREEAPRKGARPATATTPRVRLTWRSTLDWPEELTGTAEEATAETAPAADGHVLLVWR